MMKRSLLTLVAAATMLAIGAQAQETLSTFDEAGWTVGSSIQYYNDDGTMGVAAYNACAGNWMSSTVFRNLVPPADEAIVQLPDGNKVWRFSRAKAFSSNNSNGMHSPYRATFPRATPPVRS